MSQPIEGIFLQTKLAQETGETKTAGENGRHFTTPPPHPQQDNIWRTSTEIPHWWDFTDQI